LDVKNRDDEQDGENEEVSDEIYENNLEYKNKLSYFESK